MIPKAMAQRNAVLEVLRLSYESYVSVQTEGDISVHEWDSLLDEAKHLGI